METNQTVPAHCSCPGQVPGGSIIPGHQNDIVVMGSGFRSLLLCEHWLGSPMSCQGRFPGALSPYSGRSFFHLFFPPLPPLFASPGSWGHPQRPHPAAERQLTDLLSRHGSGSLIPRAALQTETLIHATKFSHSLCAH